MFTTLIDRFRTRLLLELGSLGLRARHRLERWRAPLVDSIRRVRGSDVLLVLGSVVVTLVAVEAGLRAYYLVRTSQELARMAQSSSPESIDTALGQLGPGVRASDRPGVVYELRPNLRGTYDGRRFRSDRYGFREDAEMDLAKSRGVKRVLGVGDSWMWGSGVDNGETYLDRLRELLTADGGRRVEVINTGVWGYNAKQQVATLRFKGSFFTPDVVVIGLCGNDRAYPSFLDGKRGFDLSRSFLWNEIGSRLDRSRDSSRRVAMTGDELMPHGEFLAAYAELHELAKKGNFSVVVFSECFGKGNPPAQDRTCALGNAEEWRQFVRRLDEWGFHRCPWSIDEIPQNYPRWGHATPNGNRKLASILANCVRPLLDDAVRGAQR
jgi:hypothetical protein